MSETSARALSLMESIILGAFGVLDEAGPLGPPDLLNLLNMPDMLNPLNRPNILNILKTSPLPADFTLLPRS
jgi:hypothetical protein